MYIYAWYMGYLVDMYEKMSSTVSLWHVWETVDIVC